MAGPVPISVVMPVLNEEANIGDALRSVAFAEDVLVVDSGSTDRTADIAREHGARVIVFDYQGGPMKKKAWILATQAFPHDWVLFLDGDERVTPSLEEEIRSLVRDPGTLSGAYIDRELIFMGRRMRSFRPNWNLRLFRSSVARIEDLGLGDVAGTGDNEIHEHFEVSGPTTFLASALKHEDYRGIGPWIDRHNRYATWEAELYRRLRSEPVLRDLGSLVRLDPFRRKRLLRRVWVRLPARPLLRFITWYVFRGGFRDGGRGFVFCTLMAWYELLISIKLRELCG